MTSKCFNNIRHTPLRKYVVNATAAMEGVSRLSDQGCGVVPKEAPRKKVKTTTIEIFKPNSEYT
jgi:hypothetical protein